MLQLTVDIESILQTLSDSSRGRSHQVMYSSLKSLKIQISIDSGKTNDTGVTRTYKVDVTSNTIRREKQKKSICGDGILYRDRVWHCIENRWTIIPSQAIIKSVIIFILECEVSSPPWRLIKTNNKNRLYTNNDYLNVIISFTLRSDKGQNILTNFIYLINSSSKS